MSLFIFLEVKASNSKWKKARHGRLTVSDFGKIFGRKSKTLPDNLLKHILGYCPTFTETAVEWRREHEKVATYLGS